MNASNFQFVDPTLLKLTVDLNDGFDETLGDMTTKNLFNVTVLEREESEAVVALSFQTEKTNTAPLLIEAIIASRFIWDDSLDTKKVDVFLAQNAPALLLSYLRPIIANATAYTPQKSYNIPFMNFTEEERIED